ncbi:hypothetical protein PPACK8108_LOCUS12479 [Phakopsora pachyrhizi]|uniref:Uncharacterized protein n=1 Tax=Phakopsora pachyrhizi TaxID=170000 RepID=A0AAV0B475_PHAPC|nr:hypothetical protein PPACK8108_LOCUS12479 [Phakopsora pachyrhizi]
MGEVVWKCLLCKDMSNSGRSHSLTGFNIEKDNNDVNEIRGSSKCGFSTKDYTDSDSTSDGEILNDSQSEISSSFLKRHGDGCTPTLMSRKTYNHIQVVLRLCDVQLPSWNTFQSAKTQLQKMTHCKKYTSLSDIGNPMTTVSIQGLLKQAQMIRVGDQSFYIYEPAQIIDRNVVVPLYFYNKGSKLWAKVCKLNVLVLLSSLVELSISGDLNFYSSYMKEIMAEEFLKPYHEITFNDGRPLKSICRNVLYGLTPHISNQEYNTLFVATSNIATELELAAPVAEELNIISTSRFFTFDYSLQEDVLALPVALLFMGDSPMHAEITSTMHPNLSLQPCRICKLKAKNKKEKATGTCVDNFIRQNTNGILVKPKLRSWIDTKKNAYHTWYLVQRGAPKTQTIIHTIKENQDTKLIYNITRLQDDSIEKLFNPFYELKGFDGHKDTPVEVLHVILLGIVKYLYCDLISGLTVDKKDELVAQLQSFDIANLNSFTQDFLIKLISSNAQWVNKPKFHILLHQSQSVARFGPASLFATEKFESYNGVVQQESIHSNCQSPSQDIANSFMNFSAIRYCLSGGNCISETNVSICVTILPGKKSNNSKPIRTGFLHF